MKWHNSNHHFPLFWQNYARKLVKYCDKLFFIRKMRKIKKMHLKRLLFFAKRQHRQKNRKVYQTKTPNKGCCWRYFYTSLKNCIYKEKLSKKLFNFDEKFKIILWYIRYHIEYEIFQFTLIVLIKNQPLLWIYRLYERVSFLLKHNFHFIYE